MRSIFTCLFSLLCISVFAQYQQDLFSRDPQTGEYNLPLTTIDIQQYISERSFQHGPLADTCLSVKKVYFTDVKKDQAKLHWEKGDPSTITYIARYKKLIASSYTYKVISDTTALMSGLDECTNYVFGVSSVCIQDTSGFKQVQFKTDCTGKIATESISAVDITPNPVSEVLSINLHAMKSNSFNILITNHFGSVVYKNTLSKNQPSFNLDVSRLSPGVYYLRLFDQQLIRSGRFIRL